MNITDFIPLISVIIAFLSLTYVVKNNKRADESEIKEKAKTDATLNLKLDAISNTVQDIKYDISATKKDVATLNVKVAELEASTKSAHKRIDSVEERLNP